MTDQELLEQLKARNLNFNSGAVGAPAGPPPPSQPMMVPPYQPAIQPQFQQPGPMMGQPMMQPPPQAMAMPTALGFVVPVSIETPNGEVTAMVQFGPEWASSPQAAQQLIGQLMQMGWPVKAWRPKPQGGGGGGGGGGWGGGGGGGGFNRGGGRW